MLSNDTLLYQKKSPFKNAVFTTETLVARPFKEILAGKFTQKTDYQRAKANLETLINEFWTQEQNYEISELTQAEAILNEIFETVEETGDTFNFQDLDGDTVSVNGQEELKEKVMEVIEEYIDITDDVEALVDLKLEELEF